MTRWIRTSVASWLATASVLVVAAAACTEPAASGDLGAAESARSPTAVTRAVEPSAAIAPGADPVVRLPRGPNAEVTALDLVTQIAEETGAEIVMDDACRRRLESAKVFVCFTHAVRRSELFEWLQAVLSFNDVALVRTEGGAPNGRARWTCVDRRASAVRPSDAGTDAR